MQKASRTFTFRGRIDYVKFYIYLVQALSPMKKMSDKEVEVVSAFVASSDKFAPRFSTPYRKRVRKELEMSESQMSNILKNLKSSGVLFEDSVGEILLHPAYIPPYQGAELNLKLVTEWETQKGTEQS
jgi:hypothetical protein